MTQIDWRVGVIQILFRFPICGAILNHHPKNLVSIKTTKFHCEGWRFLWGGDWIVFSKTFLRYVLKNCSQVQSLSEFRVLVQRINVREQRKKEHKQLYRFLPQTGSSPVPLALPRRVPLKCNVRLQVAQSHKKETSQCSRTTPRDFYAQSHKNETSMLKDNSKRLPLLNHYWKRLILTITKNWIRFWILDIQSEVFTKQYETEQTLFF